MGKTNSLANFQNNFTLSAAFESFHSLANFLRHNFNWTHILKILISLASFLNAILANILTTAEPIQQPARWLDDLTPTTYLLIQN